ncbi:MAG TPA: hypothetical protein VK327_08515 [Candidatus Paceibacterota bacterium]|nr:hypothetical protein [Candidatus Paceibacterota bacterium]
MEVDAVAGCEPKEKVLGKLHDFLASHCQKPDGIEIVRSDVIPVEAARGLSRRTLARRYLNGPPKGQYGTSSPAFLYILFYDGALADDQATLDQGPTAEPAAKHASERKRNPHVDILPYPAIIFMNVRYSSLDADLLLLHEAGHVLGFARRTNGAADLHCKNPKCLMNATLSWSISRGLTLRDPIQQRTFCADCEAESRENSRQPPASNLRFIGPVMVRSENGYHVLSLPSAITLIVGDLDEGECWKQADELRGLKNISNLDSGIMHQMLVGRKIDRDKEKLREVIQRAKADPLEMVRETARELERRVQKKGTSSQR